MPFATGYRQIRDEISTCTSFTSLYLDIIVRITASDTSGGRLRPLLLCIWTLLFVLPPPILLGVGLLYVPFSFLDPLFLLAQSRFFHVHVSIRLVLQSNVALFVIGCCLAILYTHVFLDRRFAPLGTHYLLASIVHKSIPESHMPICVVF